MAPAEGRPLLADPWRGQSVGKKVGWPIFHRISFSPFDRAGEDYCERAPFRDFLIMVIYNI